MKNPGLHIEVTKQEFFSKSDEEQHWILLEALMQINGHGCQYGRTRWKKMFAWATGVGLIGGFIGGITRKLW